MSIKFINNEIDNIPYFNEVKRKTYTISQNKEIRNIQTGNIINPTIKRDEPYIKLTMEDKTNKCFKLSELYYYYYEVINDVKKDIEKVKKFKKNTDDFFGNKVVIKISNNFIVIKKYKTLEEAKRDNNLSRIEISNNKIVCSKDCYFKYCDNEKIGDYLPIHLTNRCAEIDTYKLDIFNKLFNENKEEIQNKNKEEIQNENKEEIQKEIKEDEKKEIEKNYKEIEYENEINEMIDEINDNNNVSSKFYINQDKFNEPTLNDKIKLKEKEEYHFINSIDNKINNNTYIITNFGRVFNNKTGALIKGSIKDSKHSNKEENRKKELYVVFHKNTLTDEEFNKNDPRTTYKYPISKLVYFYFSKNHSIPKNKVIKHQIEFNDDENFNNINYLFIDDINHYNNKHKSEKRDFTVIDKTHIKVIGFDKIFNQLPNIKDMNLQHIFINEDGNIYNTKTKNLLGGTSQKDGYIKFTLHSLDDSKKKKDFFVHQLLGYTFKNLNYNEVDKQRNRIVIDHINNNRNINNINNINITTSRLNTIKEIGRKITKVIKINDDYYVDGIYDTIAEAERKNNISNITVSNKKLIHWSKKNNCWFRNYDENDKLNEKTFLEKK